MATFTVPLSPGKVSVATADRSRAPLVIPRSARQGPRGSSEPSCTAMGSDAPGASNVPSVAAIGPARSPSGPSVSMSVPLRSSVPWPLLWTFATTTEPPVAERSAVSDPTAKFEGGAPPGPIERYIRTPTRLTRVIPPAGGADTSAHRTA